MSSTGDDMACRELVELVTDYLEGALPPDERLDFERHLVWCSWCRDYLDHMRRTIELTGLAHRKHYHSLEGLEHWLRARFDTIAVSKARYTNVSLPRFQRMIEGAQKVLASDTLVRKQRALERVQTRLADA